MMKGKNNKKKINKPISFFKGNYVDLFYNMNLLTNYESDRNSDVEIFFYYDCKLKFPLKDMYSDRIVKDNEIADIILLYKCERSFGSPSHFIFFHKDYVKMMNQRIF